MGDRRATSGFGCGIHPIPSRASGWDPEQVPDYVLSHAHRPEECAIAIAAWKGFPSPLRGGRPLGSCAIGGHRVWWHVQAADASSALAQLPPYVASRTAVDEVRVVPIP